MISNRASGRGPGWRRPTSMLRAGRCDYVRSSSFKTCRPSLIRSGATRIQDSNVSLLQLGQEVVTRAPGQRHDGQRGILVGVRDEGAAVGDEEVFHVPSLATGVEHGSFLVETHAGRADFVNDLTGLVDGLGATGVNRRD